MEADLVWLWTAAAVLLLLMLLVGMRRTAVIIEHNPLDGSGGECYDSRHMNGAIRFFSFYFYFASLLLPRSAEEDRLL
jgi:hypothetical protein